MTVAAQTPRVARYMLLCAIALGTCTVAAMTGPAAFDRLPQAPLGSDQYDPALDSIDSLDKAEAYVRTSLRGPNSSKAQIADAIDRFVRNRFLHGTSFFAVRDDWLARSAGLFWPNLAMPISPDQIFKHRTALCSQQALVSQALLQRFGLHYASVRFTNPGHFAVAAEVESGWKFYDPDMAPRTAAAMPLTDVLAGRGLRTAYPSYGAAFESAAARGDIVVTDTDANPAARGMAFERASRFLSSFGWLIFGLLWAAYSGRIPAVAPGRMVPALGSAGRLAMRLAFAGGATRGTR